MSSGAARRSSLQSRPGAIGVGLALAALWVLILQPLGHIALLRALLQVAGPGYTIICTIDGPHLVGDSQRDRADSEDAPLKTAHRPLPDCCLAGAAVMASPQDVALSFEPDSIVVVEARPLPQARPLASVTAWRLPQPRGPPASIL